MAFVTPICNEELQLFPNYFFDLFDELFFLLNTKREEHLEFKALDPWYSYYFHTGETFNYRANISDTLNEIERFNPDDKQNYLNLLSASEKIFNVGFTKLSSEQNYFTY